MSRPVVARLALILLLLTGCAGSEQAIFSELVGVGGTSAAPAGGGGAGASTGTGSGPAGITGEATEALRTDVVFDWPQSTPSGGCEAGTYTGSFECMLGFFPLQGSLSFILDTSNESGVLEIVSGEMVGLDVAMGGVELMRADLSGTLRCAVEAFDATALDGSSLPSIPLIPIPSFDSFDASFDGSFDTATSTVTGTWRMSNVSNGLLCEGPFTARRSP